jgi:integrase
MKLTATIISKLKLPAGKSDWIVFDDDLPGFGLRLREGGSRTWIAQYRLGKKQRRLPLGTAKERSLAEARQKAKQALAQVALGNDPAMERFERLAQAAVTLGTVVERYLEHAKGKLKPRSYAGVERHLKVLWKPLHEMAVMNVRRPDVAARLNKIASDNGPITANRARASLSALFFWAIREGITDANPVVGTNKATDEVSRDRVLSNEELRLIWQEAGDGDYGEILRLLILTGQRREEVGGMLWRELTGNLWTIGSSRTKNGLPHEVPLSAEAEGILSAIARREERELVFGSRDGPFSGWSNAKAALDGRLLKALRKKHGENAKLTPWRLHDIRRTVTTGMAGLGIAPHIVEAVLNHISGHKAGVAGIYNRATYAPEKRAALALWAEHVKALTGAGSNVRPMKRAEASEVA